MGSAAKSAARALLFHRVPSIRAELDTDTRGYHVVVGIHAMVSNRNIVARVVVSQVQLVAHAHTAIVEANNHIRMEQMLDAPAHDPAVVPLLVKDGSGAKKLNAVPSDSTLTGHWMY